MAVVINPPTVFTSVAMIISKTLLGTKLLEASAQEVEVHSVTHDITSPLATDFSLTLDNCSTELPCSYSQRVQRTILTGFWMSSQQCQVALSCSLKSILH